MTSLSPPARPEMTRVAAEFWMHASGLTDDFAIVARRGYYRDTMGVPGKNDRGIYDDAMAIVTPNTFVTFNANCDPSRYEKGIARLAPGVWDFELGIHNRTRPADRQYEALIQAGPFTVTRDGGKAETGWFGINIHRGGLTTTGSAGCLTIVPSQWDAFIALVKTELARHARKIIPCVLTERGDS
jgi:hypothetical protein